MGGDWGVGSAGADVVVDAGACAGAMVPAVASTMGFFGGGRGPWLIERMAWGLATCVPGIGRALGAAPRMAPVGELGIAGERTIVGLRACCAPLRVRKGGRAGPESTRGAPGACMLGMRPWPKPGRTGRPGRTGAAWTGHRTRHGHHWHRHALHGGRVRTRSLLALGCRSHGRIPAFTACRRFHEHISAGSGIPGSC